MVVSSLLKMLFNHFKKFYLIFCFTCIILGILLLIPGIRDISVDQISLNSIIQNSFLVCSFIVSGTIGSIIYYEYGKAFALIQNNKKPLIISGLIVSLINAFIMTILLSVILICSGSLITNTISIYVIVNSLFTYVTTYYIGALFRVFIKDRKIIVLSISAVVMSFVLSFLGKMFEWINLYKIIVFSNTEHNNIGTLITIVLVGLILSLTMTFTYYKFDAKKIYCE